MDRYESVKLLGQGGEGAALLVKRKEDQQQFVCKKKTYVSINEVNEGLQEVFYNKISNIQFRSVNLFFLFKKKTKGHFTRAIQQRICYAL